MGIHVTSELREKEAAKFAKERKAKLQAKASLSLKLEKVEATNMRFAICEAAHREVKKVLRSIEHKESKLIKADTVPDHIHTEVSLHTFVPVEHGEPTVKTFTETVQKVQKPPMLKARLPEIKVQKIRALPVATLPTTVPVPANFKVLPDAVIASDKMVTKPAVPKAPKTLFASTMSQEGTVQPPSGGTPNFLPEDTGLTTLFKDDTTYRTDE